MTDNSDDGIDKASDVPSTPPQKKKSGRWVGIGFIVLLGGGMIVAQITSYSGPPIKWVYNDLDAALRQARESNRRVFLYLHRPNCPITAKHELTLFSRRFARVRLDKMIACRIELGPSDRLRARFGFDGRPIMLVLDVDGKPIIQPIRGEVGEKQFLAYIRSE